MVTELDWYKGLGTPIKFSRTPGGTRSTPPKFGEHGAAVLAKHGYSAEEIVAFEKSGVLLTKRRL
jgi:formyl-CoA transferase